jgi:hypothetical protein
VRQRRQVRRRGARQRDVEHGATLAPRLDPDAALVQVDDGAADREAEPVPVPLTRLPR